MDMKEKKRNGSCDTFIFPIFWGRFIRDQSPDLGITLEQWYIFLENLYVTSSIIV